MRAIHDEAIDHIPFCHVGKGLVHAEHIFAERAAISSVPDAIWANDELIAGSEEAQFRVAVLVDIEKVALVRVDAGSNGVVLDPIFK